MITGVTKPSPASCATELLFTWHFGWGTNAQTGVFKLPGPKCLLSAQDVWRELKELWKMQKAKGTGCCVCLHFPWLSNLGSETGISLPWWTGFWLASLWVVAPMSHWNYVEGEMWGRGCRGLSACGGGWGDREGNEELRLWVQVPPKSLGYVSWAPSQQRKDKRHRWLMAMCPQHKLDDFPDHSGLSGTFWVLAWKLPRPGKPLCPGQTGMVGHLIPDVPSKRAARRWWGWPGSQTDQGMGSVASTDPVKHRTSDPPKHQSATAAASVLGRVWLFATQWL